jgi:hypothetical protein
MRFTMQRVRSAFERIREVAKRLSSPAWIKRHGGGSEAEAVRPPAEKYGFAGRVTFMRSLCQIYADCPEQDRFESAAESMTQAGARLLVDRCSDCEVDVPASLSAGTTPHEFHVGDCYHQAKNYVADHASEGAVLVHGAVADSDGGPHTNHAWVELLGGIVFDGAVQRFYGQDAYSERRAAVKRATYDFIEAVRMNIQHRHFGPWDE